MRPCSLVILCAACASPAPAPPAPPARPAADPPILVLSEAERAGETAWLASFGLTAPRGGLLLEEPFKPPLSRRSFLVPTAWYRARSPTTIAPAALAADLDLLA